MSEIVSDVTRKLFDELAPRTEERKATKSLGKEEFLKLLTIELRHQDPTQPTSNKEMAAQLAQFSSLEQLQNINTALDGMAKGNTALASGLAQLSLPSMIGKSVKANSNALSFDGNKPSQFSYELNAPANSIRIEIRDANDKVVRSYDSPVAPGAKGMNSFAWDGKDTAGNLLPPGNYSFVVSGKDSGGNDLTITPRISGRVSGVRFDENGAMVIINGVAIPANSVTEVGE